MPGAKLDTPAKRAVRRKGLLYGHVAQKLGIPQSSLSHMLAGDRPFPREKAQRLADILDLDVSIFLDVKRDAPSCDGGV